MMNLMFETMTRGDLGGGGSPLACLVAPLAAARAFMVYLTIKQWPRFLRYPLMALAFAVALVMGLTMSLPCFLAVLLLESLRALVDFTMGSFVWGMTGIAWFLRQENERAVRIRHGDVKIH